jgi:hypothetical protein
MTNGGALTAVDSGEHTVSPQRDTIYSWCGMVSDGHMNDFPLQAMCAQCGQPIVRRRWGAPWEHRPPGEAITEPAEPDF